MATLKYRWIFLFTIIIFSCQKEHINPINNASPINPSNKWDVLWQEPLVPDTSGAISIAPILYQDKVLFSARFITDRELLFMRGQTAGALQWFSDALEGYIPITGVSTKDHYLIPSISNGIMPIDLDNGQALWKKTFSNGRVRMNQIGDDVYYANGSENLNYDTCFLERTNYLNNDWEVILTMVKKDNFRPGIEPPVEWINTKGESLLIFQNRRWNFDDGIGIVDLHAFNQVTQSFEWVVKDFTPTGNSSIHLNLIHNDKVYFTGARTISCIDLNTGEIVWQTAPGSSFASCAPIIVENKLIANGDNEDIYALDLENGTKIWEDKNSGATVNNMVYYHGHIYFASAGDGKLRCVRVADGQQIWAEDSPNEAWNSDVGFHQGISIDTEKGVLFTADGYYAMAIQLQE